MATQRRPLPTPNAALEIASFEHPLGTEKCEQRDCKNQSGVRCRYSDSRNNQCQTTWCPEHWRTVGGVVYCRRHAGTVIALGDDADPQALPDLDNRGPSLVNWVYRDVDTAMRRILDTADPAHGVSLRDPAVTVIVSLDDNRQWQRGWTLRDAHAETVHRVVLSVAERDDALVFLTVDGRLLAQGVPPWIERHRRHVKVVTSVDAAQRRLFYSFLLEHVSGALLPQEAARAV